MKDFTISNALQIGMGWCSVLSFSICMYFKPCISVCCHMKYVLKCFGCPLCCIVFVCVCVCACLHPNSK